MFRHTIDKRTNEHELLRMSDNHVLQINAPGTDMDAGTRTLINKHI